MKDASETLALAFKVEPAPEARELIRDVVREELAARDLRDREDLRAARAQWRDDALRAKQLMQEAADRRRAQHEGPAS